MKPRIHSCSIACLLILAVQVSLTFHSAHAQQETVTPDQTFRIKGRTFDVDHVGQDGNITLQPGSRNPSDPSVKSVKLGERIELDQTYFVRDIRRDGRIDLTPARSPTASIGAFIKPVEAEASSAQAGAGRTALKTINGSGWTETFPGSGVYVHTKSAGASGGSMWNGQWDAWLKYDLGQTHRLNGMYVWNYNEEGKWASRSIKNVSVLYSTNEQSYTTLDPFELEQAPGEEGYRGETISFPKTIEARYVKFEIQSNYKGNREMSGLSEVRFADADREARVERPGAWEPTYDRPQHPDLEPGEPLPDGPNKVFPEDAGVIDVTEPPYNAPADGSGDATAAIQQALDDHPAEGAIIYLPNGEYVISDTLTWGGNEDQQKQTVLWGQSRQGTVIRLRDDCPGFSNPKRPKPMIYTGHAPAQRFGNEIHNLTVDSGTGNPGATAVQFIANNQGGMYNVSIVSGDGQGVIGLDMGYTNEQGPCLIKNVSVKGFDVGIRQAHGVASETLEHITVKHQNEFGFRNDGQPCTVRDLTSVNDVPAFVAGGGFSVLLDSELKTPGGTSDQPAVICNNTLFARNVRTSGYDVAIQNRVGEKDRKGPNVDRFLSKPAVTLFDERKQSLRLPVKNTPEIPWDAHDQWIAPQEFGGKANDETDDSEAIQKAIDAGKTTVYLPHGTYHVADTIELRGSVRRLIGCKARLVPSGDLKQQEKPLIRYVNGTAPAVIIEEIYTNYANGPFYFLEHAADRALVMARLGINFQSAHAYHGNGSGPVFIEDVVGRWFRFHDQRVWARQFNVEGNGTHILNDGGSMWILGYKTEGGGTLLDTRNGGATELLGGFSYTVGEIDDSPMFRIKNARASISFAEICFTGNPFPRIVRETRNGKTKIIKQEDDAWGGVFSLFSATGR